LTPKLFGTRRHQPFFDDRRSGGSRVIRQRLFRSRARTGRDRARRKR
jgi:hypothetical protein